MIVSGAFAEAKTRRAGFMADVMVLVPALILGVVNAWAVHRVGYAVCQRSQQYSELIQNRQARCMFLGLGVWIIISVFLGDGLGWVVLRVAGK